MSNFVCIESYAIGLEPSTPDSGNIKLTLDDVSRFHTHKDILLYYRHSREAIVKTIKEQNKVNRSGIFPWNGYLCSDRCHKKSEDDVWTCLGCTLLYRFNPESKVTNGSIILASRGYRGDLYKLNVYDNSSIFGGYKRVIAIDYEPVDPRYNNYRPLYVTDNMFENYVFVGSLMSVITNNKHIVNSYICNNRLIVLTRGYNIGRGSVDGFLNYDVYRDGNIIKGWVILSIVHQLFDLLSMLSNYSYVNGDCTINALAFDNSPCINEESESWPFTVNIIPTPYDSIVYEGVQYFHYKEFDDSKEPDNDDEYKEWVYNWRKHRGWNKSIGLYEFVRFIKSLMTDEIFTSSVAATEEVAEYLSDPEKLYNDLYNRSLI